MSDLSLPVIQEFVDQFKDPKKAGQAGQGNKYLWQGEVISAGADTLDVEIDGTVIPGLRCLQWPLPIAGDFVWGIQEGRIKIVLGQLENPGSASISAPTWTAVTFQNSWVNIGAPWETTQYCKDALGWVHVKGHIQSGSIGGVVCQLPVGFRPAAAVRFEASSFSGSWGFATGYINSSGQIVAETGSNTAWSLNFSFYVGP